MRRSRLFGQLRHLISVGLLFPGACGTTQAYEGAPQPRAQVAVIQPASVFDYSAKVAGVDGIAIDVLDNSVEVLPGRRVVTLSIIMATDSSSTSTVLGDVELEAKGGALYEAHGRSTGVVPMEHWFWIVDAASQSLAGGSPPPD